MIKPEDDIVLVTDPERVLEGKNRLGRIGFDRVIGYLRDPYAVMFENRHDVEVASRLTTNALDERIADVPELQLVDVRNPGEAAAGMIANAVNIPVGQLPDRLAELTRASRQSSTAPADTVPRWPRACSGSAASTMSAIFWADTTPGTRQPRTPRSHREIRNTMSTEAKHQVPHHRRRYRRHHRGGATAAQGYTDVAVMEPSDKHYYQAMWTLVGGGQAKAALHRAVRGLGDAQEGDLDSQGGRRGRSRRPTPSPARTARPTRYDVLVVCPGIQLDWDKTEGLHRGARPQRGVVELSLRPGAADMGLHPRNPQRLSGVHDAVRSDEVRRCAAEDRLPGQRLLAQAGCAEQHRRAPGGADPADLRHPGDRRQPGQGDRRLRHPAAHAPRRSPPSTPTPARSR